MTTYYPIRAAAKHAGVSRRTIYRWIHDGLRLDNRWIRLQAVSIDFRTCIEENQLKSFLTARLKYREEQERRHEQFTIR